MNKRAIAKGYITRILTKIKTLLDGKIESDTSLKLEEFLSTLHSRLQTFDNVQEEIEKLTKLDDLDKVIDEAFSYRETVVETRIQAENFLKTLTRESSSKIQKVEPPSLIEEPNSVNTEIDIFPKISSCKLPKINLPTFSGDITMWPSFWETFSVAVDEIACSEVTKFTYLKSVLKDEAKAAVEGLSLTAANYSVAKNILNQRFGRKEKLIFAHVQELLNLAISKDPTLKQLWELYDTLVTRIRSLQNLGISGDSYGVILTPVVLSRLPQDIRLEWARKGEGHESDLGFLIDFLLSEIERRDRSLSFQDTPVLCETEQYIPSAAALLTKDSGGIEKKWDIDKCVVCHRKKNHSVEQCFNLTKAPVEQRKNILMKARCCFKCLSTDKKHNYKKCMAKCFKCSGKHHTILHVDKLFKNQTVNEVKESQTILSTEAVSNVQKSAVSSVLLQTAKITVKGAEGSADIFAIFDTGSDRSYISEEVVNKIGPNWLEANNVSHTAFGGTGYKEPQMRNVYEVGLSANQNFQTIKATEIPVICATIRQPKVPTYILQSLGNNCSVINSNEKNITVSMLIGLDVYWKLMTPDVVRLNESLVAQKSVFGWVVSGLLENTESSIDQVHQNHQLLTLNSISNVTLEKFWELDSIGICNNEKAIEDPVMSKFNNSIEYKDNRYTVSLPWKSELAKNLLLTNELNAQKRLQKLSEKFNKNKELEVRYNEALSTMEREGFIHEVPFNEIKKVENPIYYMPHRPVVRDDKTTTKVRPVFDASAKCFNKVSLNDCLETGPCLLPSLVQILIRFRRWKIAISSDIEKAFLMIKVKKEDQDVHRFFWNFEGKIRVMRFDRVPFGNKSSPFLLNATIKHHLKKFPMSRAVYELENNLYVDDLLSGSDSELESCQMYEESNEIMSKAGMNLTKWSSSSPVISEKMSKLSLDKHVNSDSSKVLGLKWNHLNDEFLFEGLCIPDYLHITKRLILGIMARLFDPLGFLNPFMVAIKCLFQKLWKLGLGWDDLIPQIYQNQFVLWVQDLEILKQWSIPRRYTKEVLWSEAKQFELHAFGDASELSYGACVYVRIQNKIGNWFCSLIISKSKIAPLKSLSLPRLELMGALLCARLLSFVKQSLKINNVVSHCWTDSTVTLSWIKGEPYQWKTFVSNRVAEIQSLTTKEQWHHCSGEINPADMVTRGIRAKELIESTSWVNGPAFLSCQVESFDKVSARILESKTSLVDNERKRESVVLVSQEYENKAVFDIGRWSSLGKAVRIVGWVLRFIHNCQNKEKYQSKILSLEELKFAKTVLIKSVQNKSYEKEIKQLKSKSNIKKSSNIFKLSPYLDSNGILRVQGRLQFSQLQEEEKHPIIIPKGHLSVLLARHIHLSQKHIGVNSMLTSLRDQYWISGARNTCKNVKRLCVSCQRHDSKPENQIMAPLPVGRINPSPPFSVSGIDHCGPLYCCDFPGKKFYILLFTCAVVRAVHLELVDSLTTEATLQAIRRFMARRGVPCVFMSDNALNFESSKRKLEILLGAEAPQWKFIAPRAPWWGGFWERMIGTVKQGLRKSVGRSSLTRVELETFLHEIEACVNSRPLTYTGDQNEGIPLTPAHFLIGKLINSKPSSSDVSQESNMDLCLRFELSNNMLQTFWHIWTKEYLRQLPPVRGPKFDSRLREGVIVLIKGENIPKLQWPLGRVLKVYYGRDGLIRSVDIRTAKGVVKRAIQHIHYLEI